ncbi:MAG: hypothetical protein BWY95_00680 [Bacteroidetes bacterium ADurb.BinA104]|nr:MAG: hypothetical protein BWY95_00680 [Bacteroidetes bacterium ADurb.BinA104]
MDEPLQISVPPVLVTMVAVGSLFTTTVVVAVALQPAALVISTQKSVLVTGATEIEREISPVLQ